MPRFSKEFGECISALLKKHGQTYRDAEEYCREDVSRSTIGNMASGIIVSEDKVRAFLGYYDRNDAVRCIQMTEYPVPADWMEPKPTDPLEAVRVALRTNGLKLSDEGKQQVEKFVKRLMEREQREDSR
jgi:hypothetical protein